jgi:uncharacterized protein
MPNVSPLAVAAFAFELAVAIAFGLAADRIARALGRLPAALRIALPAIFVVPYLLVSISQETFQYEWCVMYALVPVAIAGLLLRAARVDPEQHGNWRDWFILLVLGLAVDLRWFESAWPKGLAPLNELLLVDAGLYGFLAIRNLNNTGFNFRLRWSDWKIGLRELLLFAPLVVVLGLALGFIHPHRNLPSLGSAILRWIAIFFFTAAPEELFFRAWVQNLLERRTSRQTALMIASAIFGLSHFNKRLSPNANFNWRYVLLATIAGIFYGRAWRENRRVPASTITHASVDWIWSLWF